MQVENLPIVVSLTLSEQSPKKEMANVFEGSRTNSACDDSGAMQPGPRRKTSRWLQRKKASIASRCSEAFRSFIHYGRKRPKKFAFRARRGGESESAQRPLAIVRRGGQSFPRGILHFKRNAKLGCSVTF